jgi:hypothetical protein
MWFHMQLYMRMHSHRLRVDVYTYVLAFLSAFTLAFAVAFSLAFALAFLSALASVFVLAFSSAFALAYARTANVAAYVATDALNPSAITCGISPFLLFLSRKFLLSLHSHLPTVLHGCVLRGVCGCV